MIVVIIISQVMLLALVMLVRHNIKTIKRLRNQRNEALEHIEALGKFMAKFYSNVAVRDKAINYDNRLN